jgi:hypothetical protein
MDIGSTSQLSTLIPDRTFRGPASLGPKPAEPGNGTTERVRNAAIFELPPAPRTTHAAEMASADSSIGDKSARKFDHFIDFEA